MNAKKISVFRNTMSTHATLSAGSCDAVCTATNMPVTTMRAKRTRVHSLFRIRSQIDELWAIYPLVDTFGMPGT